ncbi:hypothetical protein EYR41_003148 [Orbilia oligospora]|uniref:DNA-directed RNA polymerase I subunit n=1 Tax=Orbilia oligospora TaxID=2813651 RepID=A0A8H2HU19_ORBOL|nr:hypothetical protein EYR41_003148 [Orbilia oligospora]
MPPKSTSKSTTTSTAKSQKQSKSKPAKSSEYVDDSDLDDDEPMMDAPPATATPKATEKTSKKRNRDGTEKVNGAGGSSSKKGKDSAAASSSKTVKDNKKTSKKVVEVVEESSEEESKSESSEEESSDKEDSEESQSESEASEPAKTSKTTQFKLPLDKDVPPGFTPLDITSTESIPSSLGGKQIFLFTAPSKFKFSDVKKIKLHSGLDGETIESDNVKFTIRRSMDSVSSSMKVMIPKQGKKGYQLASVAPTVQYLITEAPPSGRTKIGEQGLPPPPRKQPEGLKMRFMPAGYGEESDYSINEAVLPRRDLVANGDHDVVMDEAEPVVPTPKKSKGSKDQVAETPKEKKSKRSKTVEEAVVIEENASEEEIETKKSKKDKKDKKDKGRDEDGKKKKEKKSKHDEEGKKKKKHKKEKAEA